MKVSTIFAKLAAGLEAENTVREEIRNQVKELEKATRAVSSTLNTIHSNATSAYIEDAVQRANVTLEEEVVPHLRKLAGIVPDDQYFRYCNMWSFSLQSVCHTAALIFYLQHEKLLLVEDAEKMLGVTVSLSSNTSTFHIPIEDYLHGLLHLPQDLTRLAINSVTFSDFSRPLRIHSFVANLHSGFQLLNLKNDGLRKRFDAVKYEVKRIEEVVYDISVRGLQK